MNIYVANFDGHLKEQALKELFVPFGEIKSATIEMDVFTDKSRCFGYVEMPDDSQAEAAIAALNGSILEGRTMQVEVAEPKAEKRGSYKIGAGSINPYRFKKN